MKYKSILFVLLVGLLSRFLGFFKETIVAIFFGATIEADLINISLVLPNVFFSIIGAGIFTILVPFLIEIKTEGSSRRVYSFLSSLMIFILAISSIILFFASMYRHEIFKLIAPGFTDEALKVGTDLYQISMLSIPIYILIMILNGAINSEKKFGSVEIAQIIGSVISIILTYFLINKFSIKTIPYAVLIGYIGGSLTLLFYSIRKKILQFYFPNRNSLLDLKNFLVVLLPISISLSFTQIGILIEKAMSSSLVEGSISALNYSNKVMLLPVSIVASAIAMVYYPYFSERKSQNKKSELIVDLKNSISLVSVSSMPMVFMIFLFSKEIIWILFGYGRFDYDALDLTSSALSFYTIGIIFLGLNGIFQKIHFVFSNNKTVLWINIISTIVGLVTSYLLIPSLQHNALAIGSSIAAILNMLLLVFKFKRIKIDFKIRDVVSPILKLAALNIPIFIVVYIVKKYIVLSHYENKLLLITSTTSLAIIYLSIFISLLYVTKNKILLLIINIVRKKISMTKKLGGTSVERV